MPGLSLALYYEFKARGIETREPFVGNHMWDVALTDPDGYRLHFESPTDVPEGTKLSEVQAGAAPFRFKGAGFDFELER